MHKIRIETNRGGVFTLSLCIAVLLFSAVATPALAVVPAGVLLSRGGDESSIYIPEISCDSGPFRLRLPANFHDLLNIGGLISKEVVARQSKEGYVVERIHLYFRGMRIGVLHSSNDPLKYLVAFVEVTNSDWKVAGPFVVGDGLEAIQKQLGNLAMQDKRLGKSYMGDGASIEFLIDGGRLQKIEYSCYTG